MEIKQENGAIWIRPSAQELATLSLSAKLRGHTVDGEPDWLTFFTPWLTDAYAQVQRAAGTLVADHPEMATQMLSLLSDSLTKAPEPPENGASNGDL